MRRLPVASLGRFAAGPAPAESAQPLPMPYPPVPGAARLRALGCHDSILARLGEIAARPIGATPVGIAARLGEAACLAACGDLWLYATPILHASARADRPSRRRVLQILYGADALPGGLEWHGI